jgi:hypothetical protein
MRRGGRPTGVPSPSNVIGSDRHPTSWSSTPPRKSVRAVASDAQARIVTPAWRPDGAAIVAAVAQPDATFKPP